VRLTANEVRTKNPSEVQILSSPQTKSSPFWVGIFCLRGSTGESSSAESALNE